MTDPIQPQGDASLLLQGHHDPALVLLSIGLAVLAGVVAMVVSSQASRFRGVSAFCMVLAGGLLLGKTHRVICVGGGAAAVQAAALERFDVVLMDVQMPEVDGLEASRRIRAREQSEQRPPVPTIALTASAMAQEVAAAQASGMNCFVTKSSKLPVLLTEIARVLALRQDAPEVVS